MPELCDKYAAVVGEDVMNQLTQLASRLEGAKVVHVNSTRAGGGVAEILSQFIPLKRELGIDATWEVIRGDEDFFKCTKGFHNALQGRPVGISDALLLHYEEINAKNASELRAVLDDADWVFIHDPQPAALLRFFPNRKGKWIWRCHIDVSRPYRPVWRYLRRLVSDYDASVFSLAAFAQQLPHVQYLVPPSIDPFSDKNRDLTETELEHIYGEFGLDRDRPMMLQVSRFDAFKDPLGVIQAYKLAKTFAPQLQLVLAGGLADDDPEGDMIFKEVMAAAEGDPDIHVLLLPPDAHVTINALQRAADIVLQKSVKEGFGLTVTEAMWKGKPMLGGDTGGIRLQVINHHTGFLVSTPEGAALRIRYLLDNRPKIEEMGFKAKQFVTENFLLTRQLRECLTLMLGLTHGDADRINLDD